jgi:hypothetical protein
MVMKAMSAGVPNLLVILRIVRSTYLACPEEGVAGARGTGLAYLTTVQNSVIIALVLPA